MQVWLFINALDLFVFFSNATASSMKRKTKMFNVTDRPMFVPCDLGRERCTVRLHLSCICYIITVYYYENSAYSLHSNTRMFSVCGNKWSDQIPLILRNVANGPAGPLHSSQRFNWMATVSKNGP